MQGGQPYQFSSNTEADQIYCCWEKLENLKLSILKELHQESLEWGLLSLIEKVEHNYSQAQALEIQDKFRRNEFTLDDLEINFVRCAKWVQ